MEKYLQSLRMEEVLTLTLRRLFEQFGYRKYRMRRFEEYQLYANNRNFLGSENVITFHDLDGRLMAMKPDVTLSIVKNTRADAHTPEKLYYTENVYRLQRQARAYREISQMGLEYIGPVSAYTTIETAYLALRSLEAVDKDAVLEISHMGFVYGLLDSLGIDAADRENILVCLRNKNAHELRRTLEGMRLSPFYASRVETLGELSGNFEDVLVNAGKIAVNEAMYEALGELRSLYDGLCALGEGARLRLDFSIINDIDYYNGVIMQGYVRRVPHAILSGGRYDNLLKRFGRDVGAIGFALYLDELGRYYPTERDMRVDRWILDDGSDPTDLAAQMVALTEKGLRVRAERELPADAAYRALWQYRDGVLTEVTQDA